LGREEATREAVAAERRRTAAYRIVEEGLTNVLKHVGRDASPQLRLVWEDSSLLIQIDNGANLAEAHPGQAITIGHGLVGLHERTHTIGGHLHEDLTARADTD
ncbi:MAG: hypothetical protein ACRDQZ_06235, partial [Mycobacteriales bacterium]